MYPVITEKDIFKQVLVEPAKNGADKLYIVSGYATATMASYHLEFIRDIGKEISIELIVGMCPLDGLSLSNHRAFQQLASGNFGKNFSCSYLSKRPPVHSKVYAWFKGNSSANGFVGSANYTQTGFRAGQRETMTFCDPNDAIDYFHALSGDTIYCTHNDAENFIKIFHDRYYARDKRQHEDFEEVSADSAPSTNLEGLSSVLISFLAKNRTLPSRSGLNWGQRPEEHREPNQAYIRLPSTIYRTDFFPPKKVHFTVLTDDNKVLICTRAQDNAKAIHAPHNNSLIGEYFRNRLGLPSGALVKREDLEKYGRTDVEFYKIDDETYFMDFSDAKDR
jgi:hypothetical protein